MKIMVPCSVSERAELQALSYREECKLELLFWKAFGPKLLCFKTHISLDLIFPLPGIYHVHILECVHKGIYPRMSAAALFVFNELE